MKQVHGRVTGVTLGRESEAGENSEIWEAHLVT